MLLLDVAEVGLGGGEIAGIVIGCILAVVLIAVLIIMAIRYFKGLI